MPTFFVLAAFAAGYSIGFDNGLNEVAEYTATANNLVTESAKMMNQANCYLQRGVREHVLISRIVVAESRTADERLNAIETLLDVPDDCDPGQRL
jgi:hypothetical protein